MAKEGINVFIFYSGKLLLILRDTNERTKNPGAWSIVSGGIEEGETPEEALMRECREEINVAPENRAFIYTHENGNRVYVAYLTDEEYEQVHLGDEGHELRFVSVDELSTYTLAPRLRWLVDNRPDILEKLSVGDTQLDI